MVRKGNGLKPEDPPGGPGQVCSSQPPVPPPHAMLCHAMPVLHSAWMQLNLPEGQHPILRPACPCAGLAQVPTLCARTSQDGTRDGGMVRLPHFKKEALHFSGGAEGQQALPPCSLTSPPGR